MKKILYFLIFWFFVMPTVVAQKIKVDTSVFFIGLDYYLYSNTSPIELTGIVVISQKKIINDCSRILEIEEVLRNPSGSSFTIFPEKAGLEEEIIYSLYDRIFNPSLVPAGNYFIIFSYKDFSYRQMVTVLDYPSPIKKSFRKASSRSATRR